MKYILMSFLIMIGFTLFLNGQKPQEMNSLTLILTDSMKKPVAGASIYVDGELTKSESDAAGNYKIQVKQGAKKILVTADSAGRGKNKIKGKNVISMTLYSEKDKKYLTKTAASHDDKAPQRRYSSYSNIYDMIRAEVNGAQVSGNNIVLQGMKTYGGSNSALIVVDGIQTDYINNVMPSEVKSISVIKGPEAASYGMMGANGVIIIVTYRGSDKK